MRFEFSVSSRFSQNELVAFFPLSPSLADSLSFAFRSFFFRRKRRRRRRVSEDPHQDPNPSFAYHRRQVLFSSRTEGSLLSEVARRRHALLREWNATRRHHQPSRFPFEDDHRDVRREYGWKGWSDAWVGSGWNAVQVSLRRVFFSSLSLGLEVRTDSRFFLNLLRYSDDDTPIDFFGQQVRLLSFSFSLIEGGARRN